MLDLKSKGFVGYGFLGTSIKILGFGAHISKSNKIDLKVNYSIHIYSNQNNNAKMSYPTARNALPLKFSQNQGHDTNISRKNESNPILKNYIQKHRNNNQNQMNSGYEKGALLGT